MGIDQTWNDIVAGEVRDRHTTRWTSGLLTYGNNSVSLKDDLAVADAATGAVQNRHAGENPRICNNLEFAVQGIRGSLRRLQLHAVEKDGSINKGKTADRQGQASFSDGLPTLPAEQHCVECKSHNARQKQYLCRNCNLAQTITAKNYILQNFHEVGCGKERGHLLEPLGHKVERHRGAGKKAQRKK